MAVTRPGPPKTHIVRGKAQREALASPLRMEIIGYFEQGTALSVRDVATRIGRPVASMYFHIHKLVRAGLLVEAFARGEGVASETVYCAVADRIALELNPRSRSSVDGVVKSVRSVLRQVGREFESACRTPSLFENATGQDVAGRRQRVWLTKADAAEVRRRLDAVERFLMKRNRPSDGMEHTWTSLLIPVAAPRQRHQQSEKGRKK